MFAAQKSQQRSHVKTTCSTLFNQQGKSRLPNREIDKKQTDQAWIGIPPKRKSKWLLLIRKDAQLHY